MAYITPAYTRRRRKGIDFLIFSGAALSTCGGDSIIVSTGKLNRLQVGLVLGLWPWVLGFWPLVFWRGSHDLRPKGQSPKTQDPRPAQPVIHRLSFPLLLP